MTSETRGEDFKANVTEIEARRREWLEVEDYFGILDISASKLICTQLKTTKFLAFLGDY